MPREVVITDDEVVARLTGWAAAAALKREVRVPLRALRSVRTTPFGETGLRLAGTSIPWTDVRAGRFRRNGRWLFLSFEHRDRVLTLELDRTASGTGYDVVALGVDDPEALAAGIEARRAV